MFDATAEQEPGTQETALWLICSGLTVLSAFLSVARSLRAREPSQANVEPGESLSA